MRVEVNQGPSMVHKSEREKEIGGTVSTLGSQSKLSKPVNDTKPLNPLFWEVKNRAIYVTTIADICTSNKDRGNSSSTCKTTKT